MRYAALFAVLAAVLTACPSRADLDKVMGRAVESVPAPTTQRIDCDLVFPGPDHR